MIDDQDGNVGHSNLHKTTHIHILKSLNDSLINICMEFAVTNVISYRFGCFT
jgi:hypothetical protein